MCYATRGLLRGLGREKSAMSRLVREIRAFFSSPTLMGATAVLASLAGGIWILAFYGARSLLAAAAVYGACGIVAYVYLRQGRGVEPGLGSIIFLIFVWPFIVILDTYDVMQWGYAPDRFSVTVMPALEDTLRGQGRVQELGSFRKWDEAVHCAREKAKDLGVDVWISDRPRRWMYLVDPVGRIERRKLSRHPWGGFE